MTSSDKMEDPEMADTSDPPMDEGTLGNWEMEDPEMADSSDPPMEVGTLGNWDGASKGDGSGPGLSVDNWGVIRKRDIPDWVCWISVDNIQIVVCGQAYILVRYQTKSAVHEHVFCHCKNFKLHQCTFESLEKGKVFVYSQILIFPSASWFCQHFLLKRSPPR